MDLGLITLTFVKLAPVTMKASAIGLVAITALAVAATRVEKGRVFSPTVKATAFITTVLSIMIGSTALAETAPKLAIILRDEGSPHPVMGAFMIALMYILLYVTVTALISAGMAEIKKLWLETELLNQSKKPR